MKLYMVMGHTGDYADATEWPVVAYAHAASAHAHLRRATAWTATHRCDWHNLSTERRLLFYPDAGEQQLKNPWDPEMQVDYTGVRYSVVSVPYMHRLPAGLPLWPT